MHCQGNSQDITSIESGDNFACQNYTLRDSSVFSQFHNYKIILIGN